MKRKKGKEKNETSNNNRNMPIYKWSNYEKFIFFYSKNIIPILRLMIEL